MMEVVIGLLLAFSIPLIFLCFILQLDFYQTGQFKTVLLSLALGGIAAALAAIINRSLDYFDLLSVDDIRRFVAPFHEEIIKGLFVLYVIRRSRFSYSVDGILYGFSVGIGFAVIENYFFVTDGPLPAINIAFQRIFTTSLVHAFSSAIVGIALESYRSRNSQLQVFIPIIGFVLAIGQHMLYNNAIYAIYTTGNHDPVFVTFIPGVLGIYFIYVVMKRGRKQAQEWIKEKLGMTDRVTRSEVTAIDHFASTDDIFLPVIERFGVEKAKQVEQLLYLQARIGIKRKSLDGVKNNLAMHNAIESDIDEMRTEMEQIRRSIGTYAMLFVRGLFTEEMVSVWERMQAKIWERSAETVGQIGGGLWSSLDERLKSTAENEGSD